MNFRVSLGCIVEIHCQNIWCSNITFSRLTEERGRQVKLKTGQGYIGRLCLKNL